MIIIVISVLVVINLVILGAVRVGTSSNEVDINNIKSVLKMCNNSVGCKDLLSQRGFSSENAEKDFRQLMRHDNEGYVALVYDLIDIVNHEKSTARINEMRTQNL